MCEKYASIGHYNKMIIDIPAFADFLIRGLIPTPSSHLRREHLLDSDKSHLIHYFGFRNTKLVINIKGRPFSVRQW